jgi:hypothetical protein
VIKLKKWQDKVIMVVGFGFGFMLIPMLIDSINGYTVNLVSSGLTALGLYTMSYCFFTLDMKLAMLSNMFSATMWAILFILGIA